MAVNKQSNVSGSSSSLPLAATPGRTTHLAGSDVTDFQYHANATGKRHRTSSDLTQQYHSSPEPRRQWATPSAQGFSESPRTTDTPSHTSAPPNTPSPIGSPLSLQRQRQGSNASSSVTTQPMTSSPMQSHPTSTPNKKQKRAATNGLPAYPSDRRGSTANPQSQSQNQGHSFGSNVASGAFPTWPNRPSDSSSSSNTSSGTSSAIARSAAGPFSSYSVGHRTFSGSTQEIVTTRIPSSASLPSASAVLQSPADNELVNYLRAVFTEDEVQWEAYVRRKNSVLKISELIEQYKYVQNKLDAYVGKRAPTNLKHAAHTEIRKVEFHCMMLMSLVRLPDPA